MPELLLDENLSWRVARGLRARGYAVLTISDAQLTGQKDSTVFRYAQVRGLVIVSRDDDFRTRFAPPHAGIIIVNAPNAARNADILMCLLAQLPALLAQPLANRIHSIEC
jgi:predicted nuclease of predicted toxin-antitoxin system